MRKIFFSACLILSLILGNLMAAQSQRTIIFIDGSGSMAGYLSGSYAQFMKDMETTLFLAGINQNSYVIKRVGGQIFDYRGRLAMFGVEKDLYNEATTNLAAVADYLRKSLPDLVLIISDWELDVGSGRQASDECISGYDLACMRLKFSQLMRDSGYYLTIVGLKTRYEGFLYPPGEKTKLKLSSAIYRPVYIFILARPEIKGLANNLIRAFEDELIAIKKHDTQLVFRKLVISPFEFPQVDLKFNKDYLETDSGKSTYLVLERSSDRPDFMRIVFKRIRNITSREKITLDIPYESSFSGDSAKVFVNTVEYTWHPLLKSASINIDENKISIMLPRDINVGKKRELRLKVISQIEKSAIEIWRDWSTSDPKSQDYLAGKTLHFSDFLEYLFNYAINLRGESAKQIYDLTLEFRN